jgi:GTPase SAR1 family protein
MISQVTDSIFVFVQSFFSQLKSRSEIGLNNSDRESFENVNKWVEDVRAERGNEVVMMLVGNKYDLSATR